MISSPQANIRLPHVLRDSAIVALLSLGVYVVAHWQALNSYFVVANDVRQQLFWMQAWCDPALFPPGGLLTDYSRQYVPWGVQGLFWLGTRGMDPLWFSKILTGLLYAATGVGMYLLGRRAGGRAGGFACAAVFWCMPFFLYRISGALSRGFGPPLLVMFWAGWAWRNTRVMAVSLLLQALCIPYIFLLCGLASGVAWLGSMTLGRTRRAWRAVFPAKIWHFVVLGLSAVLVLLFRNSYSQAGFGPLVDRAAMAGRPEFGPLGRYAVTDAPSLLFELVARPLERLAPFHENKV
ncbi:MAG: hypothetical protein D6E12_11285, partial [Desulfovibrio sp.]